jgi:hypothetical protein
MHPHFAIVKNEPTAITFGARGVCHVPNVSPQCAIESAKSVEMCRNVPSTRAVAKRTHRGADHHGNVCNSFFASTAATGSFCGSRRAISFVELSGLRSVKVVVNSPTFKSEVDVGAGAGAGAVGASAPRAITTDSSVMPMITPGQSAAQRSAAPDLNHA